MRRFFLPIVAIVFAIGVAGFAQQTSTSGPYKVVKTARVGGEGGWDYIFADTDGRRLYIPRGATRPAPGGDVASVLPAAGASIAVFDLDSLNPVGEIPDTGGNGVMSAVGGKILATVSSIAFDAKTNHLLTMSQEFGPASATPAPGGRGGGRGLAVPGWFTILMIGK